MFLLVRERERERERVFRFVFRFVKFLGGFVLVGFVRFLVEFRVLPQQQR